MFSPATFDFPSIAVLSLAITCWLHWIDPLYFFDFNFDDKTPYKLMTEQQLTKPITKLSAWFQSSFFILICFRLEAKPAKLFFTCWGSPFEWKAVEKVIQQFNQQHSNIRVRSQHIPNSNYPAKLLTMVVAGTAPDIAYIPDPMILTCASTG